jgi:hypothetical protein
MMHFADVLPYFLKVVPGLTDLAQEERRIWPEGRDDDALFTSPLLGTVLVDYLRNVDTETNSETVSSIFHFLETLVNDSNVNLRDLVSTEFCEAILSEPALFHKLDRFIGEKLREEFDLIQKDIAKPWWRLW